MWRFPIFVDRRKGRPLRDLMSWADRPRNEVGLSNSLVNQAHQIDDVLYA